MLHEIKGNLLNVKEGVIAHQTNCVGGFGGGVAGQIAAKYPEVRTQALNHVHKHIKNNTNETKLFGSCLIVPTSNRDIEVANLFGQFEYRNKEAGYDAVYTNYTKLEQALIELRDQVHPEVPIFFPHGIGCGLANGQWGRVHKILNKVFKDRDNIFIVRYMKK